MRTFGGSILSCLLAVVPMGAAAQGGDDELARVHFEAGSSYYDRGEYERAISEFERSYELSQRPTLFYNLSLAHQQLGQSREAADYLGRYLSEVENVPNRANLERRLQNLRNRISSETTSPQPNTSDASTVPATPPPDVAPPPPPPEVNTTPAMTTPPATAETSDGGGVPLGSIVAFSAAGAGLVMMATFGLLAISEQSSIEDGCGATQSCSSDDVSTMDTFALLSDLGLGMAVVGTGLGLLFLFVQDDGERSPQANLSPWLSPNGGGLTLGGTL